MTLHDDIDEEVDRDMGWDRLPGAPKTRQRRRASLGPKVYAVAARLWQAVAPLRRFLADIARRLAKVAFFPLIGPFNYSRTSDGSDTILVKRSLPHRLLNGLLARLLLTPVILTIFLLCVVYANTHPAHVLASNTPESVGVFFQRVELLSIDNQRLAAWYIPPLTTDDVAFDPENALIEKYPAVVICHGLGAAQDQYLPLAEKLHHAGFAVLMLDTRGQGESGAGAVTYGLRERMDVLAGVKYLRERESVDAAHVCVVGHDISATAVMQATALDSSIAAVVADGMWPGFDGRAEQIFGRASGGEGFATRWLAPLYTTAFEAVVRDSLSQLDPAAVLKSLHTQPVLFIARTGDAYLPVQQVLTLATSVGSRHRVIIADDAAKAGQNVDSAICDFLTTTIGWHGPNAHGIDQIKNLLRNQVQ
jgi:pimeloyl-ACP methyl ester carboxylesterase